METIKNLYTSLIIKIKSYAPKTPIAVISIMPTEKENKRITEFNSWLEEFASSSESITYIDIFTALFKLILPDEMTSQFTALELSKDIIEPLPKRLSICNNAASRALSFPLSSAFLVAILSSKISTK